MGHLSTQNTLGTMESASQAMSDKQAGTGGRGKAHPLPRSNGCLAIPSCNSYSIVAYKQASWQQYEDITEK